MSIDLCAHHLDLLDIPTELHGRAIEAFVQGDAQRLLGLADNTRGLRIVVANRGVLADRGILEETVLTAYTAARTGWAGWSYKAFLDLLALADPEMLRAAGDRLPPGDRFKLYRGVAGTPPHRKVRGFSWTSSLEAAAWFARRGARDGGLHDPAVYTATVSREAIYAYTNERNEEDFLVLVPRASRLNLSPEEIEELAARVDARKRRDVENWLESVQPQ